MCQRNMEQSEVSLKIIADDVLLQILFFLDVESLVCMEKTCKHFYNLAKHRNIQKTIDGYWANESKQFLSKCVNSNPNISNWQQFYFELKV